MRVRVEVEVKLRAMTKRYVVEVEDNDARVVREHATAILEELQRSAEAAPV